MDRGMLARGLVMSVLTRMGVLGVEEAIERWVRWYAGMPETRIRALSLRVVDELTAFVRPGAKDAIAFHRNAGADTVILSASPAHVCNPLARRLCMSEALCTRLDVRDGLLTGSLAGPYCFAGEKLLRADRYCASRGQSLGDAWYYADSIHDLPVLASVGHPVCVTPDRRLQAVARRRNWEIVGG